MKPTRQQLLIACGLSPDYTDDLISHRLASDLYRLEDKVKLHQAFNVLTSLTEWSIPVVIQPASTSRLSEPARKSLQVPIEPLDQIHIPTALAWCLNETRSLTLRPHPLEPNLLVQAINAGLTINRYLPTDRTDKHGHLISVLDKGSILLAFELAGEPAPKDYELWRAPDGVSCPLRAEIRADKHFGTATVHYHNGELALVTSSNGFWAKVVHVSRLEDASFRDLKGLVATNTKKESKGEGKALSATDFKSEASRWLKAKV